MVDESHCIAQGLRKPTSQVACNQHPCVEYTAGPFGDVCNYSINIYLYMLQCCSFIYNVLIVVLFCCFFQCSVTCGEGQQTREVLCVGGRGERVPEHHCRGLTRPHEIRSCQRPACHQVFRYYTNDFSLVRKGRRGRKWRRKPISFKYFLLSVSFSALVAVELVLVSAEWYAWIWIIINMQMIDVLLLADLMLWRTATHSPALVHKVSLFMVIDCVYTQVFERSLLCSTRLPLFYQNTLKQYYNLK